MRIGDPEVEANQGKVRNRLLDRTYDYNPALRNVLWWRGLAEWNRQILPYTPWDECLGAAIYRNCVPSGEFKIGIERPNGRGEPLESRHSGMWSVDIPGTVRSRRFNNLPVFSVAGQSGRDQLHPPGRQGPALSSPKTRPGSIAIPGSPLLASVWRWEPNLAAAGSGRHSPSKPIAATAEPYRR